MYSTEILSNTATTTERNLNETDSVLLNIVQRDTQDYAPLHSKNSIESTYSNFPCHLKVNKDKLALINRLWKCKKGERLTINANSCTKIDQLDGFRPLFWSVLENSARSRNQSDCWIC